MYRAIRNPSMLLYTPTGAYFARMEFTMPPETEARMLDLVNYSKVPSTLVLQDVTLYPAADNCDLTIPYEPHDCTGIWSALFVSTDTGLPEYHEIHMAFQAHARSARPDDPYHYASVALKNIRLLPLTS